MIRAELPVESGFALCSRLRRDPATADLPVILLTARAQESDVETGFDCSGVVKAMYEQGMGLILPRRADEQARATQQIERGELQPGDLVFFNTMRRTFSHVGIYIGDNKFIHSPKPGAQVRVEDMGVPYWATRFDGARRVQQVTAER